MQDENSIENKVGAIQVSDRVNFPGKNVELSAPGTPPTKLKSLSRPLTLPFHSNLSAQRRPLRVRDENSNNGSDQGSPSPTSSSPSLHNRSLFSSNTLKAPHEKQQQQQHVKESSNLIHIHTSHQHTASNTDLMEIDTNLDDKTHQLRIAEGLETELFTLKAEVTSLEQSYGVALKELERSEQELFQMQPRLARELELLQQQAASADAENRTKHQALVQAQGKLQVVEEKIVQSSTEIQELRNEIVSIENETLLVLARPDPLNILQERIFELETLIEEQHAELDLAGEEIAMLEGLPDRNIECAQKLRLQVERKKRLVETLKVEQEANERDAALYGDGLSNRSLIEEFDALAIKFEVIKGGEAEKQFLDFRESLLTDFEQQQKQRKNKSRKEMGVVMKGITGLETKQAELKVLKAEQTDILHDTKEYRSKVEQELEKELAKAAELKLERRQRR